MHTETAKCSLTSGKAAALETARAYGTANSPNVLLTVQVKVNWCLIYVEERLLFDGYSYAHPNLTQQ
jgi:hypothetical protein